MMNNNQNNLVKGAYRGLIANNRTAPKLRRIINSKYSEKILNLFENKNQILE